MLCDSGLDSCTALTAPGTSFRSSSLVAAPASPALDPLPRSAAARTSHSSRRDSASGSAAAMMALTTATPSRGFPGGLPRNSTCGMLEALMPPMHTAGTPPWPLSARTARVCLSPSGPMTFFVFVFLQRWTTKVSICVVCMRKEGRVGGVDARLGGEDGAYAQVVGALSARREGLFDGVGRDADDLAGPQQLPGGAHVWMQACLSEGPGPLSTLTAAAAAAAAAVAAAAAAAGAVVD